MSKQKTSIEWLEKQIKDHNLITPSLTAGFELLLAEAKEMHKQEIVSAVVWGIDCKSDEEGEEYYNEIYGK